MAPWGLLRVLGAVLVLCMLSAEGSRLRNSLIRSSVRIKTTQHEPDAQQPAQPTPQTQQQPTARDTSRPGPSKELENKVASLPRSKFPLVLKFWFSPVDQDIADTMEVVKQLLNEVELLQT